MAMRVLERQANEATRNNPPALWPEMSYRQALNCHFTLDQVTYRVGDCSGHAFKRLVRECGQAALPSRNLKLTHLEELLHLLEQDGSDVARWYAINVLLDHKVAVPLEVE
jgi:hypothetical protein